MIINVTGTTIKRQNGLSLIEYSAGDHEESYYKIVNTKTRDEVNYAYLSPKRNHRQALRWFQECIRDYTK